MNDHASAKATLESLADVARRDALALAILEAGR